MALLQRAIIILCGEFVGGHQRPIEDLLPASLISFNHELQKRLGEGIENCFLLLLRRGCRHSDTFSQALALSSPLLPQGRFFVFYCGWDGFCHDVLKVRHYPDFRFYPSTSHRSAYVSYSQNEGHAKDPQHIRRFVERNTNPLLPPVALSALHEDFMSHLSSETARFGEGVVLFCDGDIDTALLLSLLRLASRLWALPLLECEREVLPLNSLVNKFLRKRKEDAVVRLAAVRFSLGELSLFDQPVTREHLLPFLAVHANPLLVPFTADIAHASIVQNKTVVLLFEGGAEHRSTLRATARQPALAPHFLFAFCDMAVAPSPAALGGYYGCPHLKRLAGVAQEELPAIRLLRFAAREPVVKFAFAESEVRLWKLVAFLHRFISGGIAPYTKNGLPLREGSSPDWQRAVLPTATPTFIFVYGDEQLCPVCDEKKKEFLDFAADATRPAEGNGQKIAFYVADVLRNELDDLIIGTLPMMMVVDKGQKDVARARTSLYRLDVLARDVEAKLRAQKEPALNEEL